MKKYKNLLIFLGISFAMTLALPAKAMLTGDETQAVLLISPQSGSFNTNDTFKLNIYVNTNNQSINAVTAHLKYEKNYFQALSIDTTESVFNMIAESKIDENAGKVRVTVGVPTPGIKTTNGLVAAVTFKAIADVTPISDNFAFDFTAGDETRSSVFLDDKKGTDILSGVNGAKFQVGEGGPYSHSEGTLIKLVGGSKVYVISEGKKRWIPTAEVFNSNGYRWADIIEVAQTILDSFGIGPDMELGIGSIPEGALIRAKGDFDVYIVKYVGSKKFKRLILSPSVFKSYQHLKWSDVKDIDKSVVDSFTTSELVRAVSDSKVYKLYPSGDTGQKRWIQTADAFVSLGFDWDAIYEINQVDRDSYISGEPLD